MVTAKYWHVDRILACSDAGPFVETSNDTVQSSLF